MTCWALPMGTLIEKEKNGEILLTKEISWEIEDLIREGIKKLKTY